MGKVVFVPQLQASKQLPCWTNRQDACWFVLDQVQCLADPQIFVSPVKVLQLLYPTVLHLKVCMSFSSPHPQNWNNAPVHAHPDVKQSFSSLTVLEIFHTCNVEKRF